MSSYKPGEFEINHLGLISRLNARRILAKRFGWICWYCGFKIPIDKGHLDHIIPRSQGGTNHAQNLALTCNFCNMAKLSNSLDTFMNWLEWVRSGNSFTPLNMDTHAVQDALYKAKTAGELELNLEENSQKYRELRRLATSEAQAAQDETLLEDTIQTFGLKERPPE